MCLVSIAWRAHPRWPLVVLGNRDEFHSRPSLPAARWPDADSVHGGRDARSGGTWLAATPASRVAVVTNHREPGAMDPAPRSRGALVADWVTSATLPADDELDDYGAFHLLAVAPTGLSYVSNRAPRRELGPGFHTLSNAPLGARWPKIERLESGLSRLLAAAGDDLEREPLLALLADAETAPDSALPETGVGADLERFLSPPFIAGDRYGTRCSTLVAFHASGRGVLVERSFGPNGARGGDVVLEL